MQRTIFLLLASTLLLTACFSWWRSTPPAEEQAVSPPQGGEVQETPLSPETTPDEIEAPEVPTPTPQSADEPVLQQWQPKVLTQEEQKFVTGIDEWMEQMRTIVFRIRKLAAAARGNPVDLGEDMDLREKYAVLHEATGQLPIPAEYSEVIALTQAFDETIGQAIALLSTPPTLQELEEANALINALIPQMNELNRLLHGVRY